MVQIYGIAFTFALWLNLPSSHSTTAPGPLNGHYWTSLQVHRAHILWASAYSWDQTCPQNQSLRNSSLRVILNEVIDDIEKRDKWHLRKSNEETTWNSVVFCNHWITRRMLNVVIVTASPDSNLISSNAKKTTTNTQHIRSHSLHKKLSVSGGGGRSMISLSLHCHCQPHSLCRLVCKRDISSCLNVLKITIYCIQ